MTRERETFLARWSRRKREAAPAAKPEPEEARADALQSGAPDAGERSVAPEQKAQTQQAQIDPSALPNVEDISAETDIRAFLQPGVPRDLSRAALRRAWAADPAIRDFVGLAENTQDFNAPDAILGFGPLQATEQVVRMVNAIVGEGSPTAADHVLRSERDEAVANLPAAASGPPTDAAPHNSLSDLQGKGTSGLASPKAIASADTSPASKHAGAAVHPTTSESERTPVRQAKEHAVPMRTKLDEKPHPPPRRRCGGALPT